MCHQNYDLKFVLYCSSTHIYLFTSKEVLWYISHLRPIILSRDIVIDFTLDTVPCTGDQAETFIISDLLAPRTLEETLGHV